MSFDITAPEKWPRHEQDQLLTELLLRLFRAWTKENNPIPVFDKNRIEHNDVLFGFTDWLFENYGISAKVNYTEEKILADGITITMPAGNTPEEEIALFVQALSNLSEWN